MRKLILIGMNIPLGECFKLEWVTCCQLWMCPLLVIIYFLVFLQIKWHKTLFVVFLGNYIISKFWASTEADPKSGWTLVNLCMEFIELMCIRDYLLWLYTHEMRNAVAESITIIYKGILAELILVEIFIYIVWTSTYFLLFVDL